MSWRWTRKPANSSGEETQRSTAGRQAQLRSVDLETTAIRTPGLSRDALRVLRCTWAAKGACSSARTQYTNYGPKRHYISRPRLWPIWDSGLSGSIDIFPMPPMRLAGKRATTTLAASVKRSPVDFVFFDARALQADRLCLQVDVAYFRKSSSNRLFQPIHSQSDFLRR